ncbi:hypothetical protein ACFYS8_15265 [Kitasatospora sp. NPDC004615]
MTIAVPAMPMVTALSTTQPARPNPSPIGKSPAIAPTTHETLINR